jgi:hypothetical protein
MQILVRKISAKFINKYKKFKNYIRAYGLMLRTLYYKECYFGPFVGEFGHLLSHVVPFLSYLHSKGVKIHYCGPEIHRTFFIDEKGKPIFSSYFALRDFYSEASPDCNNQLYPDDVKKEILKFINKAKNSKLPFWDIRNRDFYWGAFCRWEYRNNFLKVYNLSKVFKTKDEDSVVIFPRKKGLINSSFYGAPWNFEELASELKHLFKTVYVVGHPSFSSSFKSVENIKVHLTTNNKEILQICSNSSLIINQLSGTHYLGIYTQTPVLFIYKGVIQLPVFNKKVLHMRSKLGDNNPIKFAHNINEIINYIKENIKQ